MKANRSQKEKRLSKSNKSSRNYEDKLNEYKYTNENDKNYDIDNGNNYKTTYNNYSSYYKNLESKGSNNIYNIK